MVAGKRQKVQSEIKWATPELEAQWRELAALIEANQAIEAELQEKAQRYGASVGMDPNGILVLRLQALLDLLWPVDTAEGQASRLQHDFIVQRQMKRNLDQMSVSLGQQLLAMGSMLPPEQLAALQQQSQMPAGLVNGGPERRSRNQQRRGK